MNEHRGMVAGAREGVTAGSCITRGCGADAMLREYVRVCLCVYPAPVQDPGYTLTDSGEPVPVGCGTRVGYRMKVFQESWKFQGYV